MKRVFVFGVATVALVVLSVLGYSQEWVQATSGWTPPTEDELMEADLVQGLPAGPVEEVEEVAGGGGAAPLSPADFAVGDLKVNCWGMYADPCTSEYMVSAGTAWGLVDYPSHERYANNFFDGATDDCDQNQYMGHVPNGSGLTILLEGVGGFDGSDVRSGCVDLGLWVDEYDSSDCTGTKTRGTYADRIQFVTTYSGYEYARAYCDDKAACSGSLGDSCNDWHKPDVYFSDNVTNDYRSYKVMVYSRVCDTDCSSNCTSWAGDTDGCFYVYRY